MKSLIKILIVSIIFFSYKTVNAQTPASSQDAKAATPQQQSVNIVPVNQPNGINIIPAANAQSNTATAATVQTKGVPLNSPAPSPLTKEDVMRNMGIKPIPVQQAASKNVFPANSKNSSPTTTPNTQ